MVFPKVRCFLLKSQNVTWAYRVFLFFHQMLLLKVGTQCMLLRRKHSQLHERSLAIIYVYIILKIPFGAFARPPLTNVLTFPSPPSKAARNSSYISAAARSSSCKNRIVLLVQNGQLSKFSNSLQVTTRTFFFISSCSFLLRVRFATAILPMLKDFSLLSSSACQRK